jgi:phosphopentomutase
MRKAIVLVYDSLGVGAMPDAAAYGDEGANTAVHLAQVAGGLNAPVLGKLGLGNIVPIPGMPPEETPAASFGRMAEASPAKDTVTGHWELMGLISRTGFALHPDGFPEEIIAAFEAQTGLETMYNQAASGTVILEQLGREHMESGKLIVYTSADSVFQVAAHEQVIPLDTLYAACRTARAILDPYRVARVIARPFVGSPGSFVRTYNRKDFCMEPPAPTLLDHLTERGIPVIGVGKIEDIFAGKGVSESYHTEGNRDGLERTLELNRKRKEGLLFVNLVDFDMVFGHRRNAAGYARAIEEADLYLGRLLADLEGETALFVTADHGCDPTHMAHTDHTREYVPILYYAPGLPARRDLGTRTTFADLAATVARCLSCPAPLPGRPFQTWSP